MRKILYSIALILFLIVSSAGCIENPPSQQPPQGVAISWVNGEMPLNYSEVLLINFSSVKPILENKSYVVKNASSQNETQYYICIPNERDASRPLFDFLINASSQNENQSAKLKFWRAPNYAPSPNETYEINLIKEKANEVAEICNLTLDWNKATIKVTYSD